MNSPKSRGWVLTRVECVTCGWFNESYDAPWTRHAGVVHSTMLCVGHEVVEVKDDNK